MIIHLHDRRLQAADLIPKLQHATAGIPLLIVGMGKLAIEDERPMAILEIAVAAAVLVTFARELRSVGKQHASHSAVSWFDIAAAGLLMLEAFSGHHHKPGYLRPQFFSAVATLGLGLMHGRFHAFRQRRRYVRLDEDGLEIRTSRFRKLSLAWRDLTSVDVAGNKAVFLRNDGRRHTVRLNMLVNHAEVRKGIAEHARAAGVATE